MEIDVIRDKFLAPTSERLLRKIRKSMNRHRAVTEIKEKEGGIVTATFTKNSNIQDAGARPWFAGVHRQLILSINKSLPMEHHAYMRWADMSPEDFTTYKVELLLNAEHILPLEFKEVLTLFSGGKIKPEYAGVKVYWMMDEPYRGQPIVVAPRAQDLFMIRLKTEAVK